MVPVSVIPGLHTGGMAVDASAENDGADQVFLYAGSNRKAMTACLESSVDRLVLHGPDGYDRAAELQQLGVDRRIMVDPELYLPVSPHVDLDEVSAHTRAHLSAQRSVEVDAFVGPTKLAPSGDITTLEGLLRLGETFVASANHMEPTVPAYTTLVMSPDWMRDAERVVDLVARVGVPIALVLASSYDPVADEAAIQVLASLIHAAPRSMLLRTDLAAIGALALGMDRAAVGATSTTRHLWIGRGRRRARSGAAPTYVFVPTLRSWHNLDEVDFIEGGDDYFACAVDAVIRDVREFANPVLRDLEPVHMIAAVRQLAASLSNAGPSVRHRVEHWASLCDKALDAHLELEAETGAQLAPPRCLKAWRAVQLPA